MSTVFTSISDPDPNGSGYKEGKNDPQKYNKVKKNKQTYGFNNFKG